MSDGTQFCCVLGVAITQMVRWNWVSEGANVAGSVNYGENSRGTAIPLLHQDYIWRKRRFYPGCDEEVSFLPL